MSGTCTIYRNGKNQVVELPAYVKDVPMAANAQTVFDSRYLRKDVDGETAPAAFYRVANVVAARGEEETNERSAERFYKLLSELKFLPNSPTWTGAGTPLGQLAACFVLPVEDNLEGILQTLRDAALIQKTGGGNGFDFSSIRPKGSPVASSGGVASGPVSVMRMYDGSFGEISQGGARRGANMAILRVDHPDILEFIQCKRAEGDLSNFNISVGVTDAFMQAALEGREYDLFHERTGKTGTLPAADVLDLISESAANNGEPGVVFLDAMNRDNPVPNKYTIVATNPCGEQPLGPYESCCLGSINLAKFCSGGRVDVEDLTAAVYTAVRFLDSVIDANGFVPGVPQVAAAARDTRRIGLGITGLADMLVTLGYSYGSDDAAEFVENLMLAIRVWSMQASVDLAVDNGPFPAFEGSVYDYAKDQRRFNSTFDKLRSGAEKAGSFVTPADVNNLCREVAANGLRNSVTLTVAPTGTISTVAGTEGYGGEPIFALGYTRTVKNPDGDIQLSYVSKLLEKHLDGLVYADAFGSEDADYVRELAAREGSVQSLTLESLGYVNHKAYETAEAVRRLKSLFATARDVTPAGHVAMQAALQKYVDSAVSKTCNLPANTDTGDVTNIVTQAWESGCKGITVYVDGSREKVVLSPGLSEKPSEAPEAPQGTERPLPGVGLSTTPSEALTDEALPGLHGTNGTMAVEGRTVHKQTPLGKVYVTTNSYDGAPYEVFVNVGKAGSATAAVSEAIGRLLSQLLQVPSSVSPAERLAEAAAQLKGIGGSRSYGFGPGRVASLPDGIAQALLYEDGTGPVVAEAAATAVGDICPGCGEGTYLPTEGCHRCVSCGYSEC